MNLDFPRKIQIQTINRCNYSCGMCPYPAVAEGSRLQYLDEGLYSRMLDELRREGRAVRLCLMLQNEPFLDRRFLALLAMAHDADDVIETISAVSNGSALSPQLLDELTAYDRFRLTVSVNANDRERYLEVHQRDLWNQIHGLFSTWTGARDRIRLSFVVDHGSVADAVVFQDYWRRRGYATRLVPMNTRISAVDQVSAWHEVDEGFGHCAYPVETLTVLVDGRVILCCNDWEHSLDFGNLHQMTIREVWNQPSMVAYRTSAVEGTLRQFEICSGCDYPTRSVHRLHLEALVSGAPPPVAGENGFVQHVAQLRASDQAEPWPVAIVAIREEEGLLEAFAEASVAPIPEHGLLQFPIGFARDLSFGDLEPTWCPADIDCEPGAGIDGLIPLRIRLHEDAPQYRFFSWYCADWRVPNIHEGRQERRDHGERSGLRELEP